MTTSPSGQARKTVTVLFCDLTGSTALGERLDPESLREVIQHYFVEMRAVIERHGGTIEKFIGDAVMAVFGVPRVHEDDALRAVRAAADMQAALAAANAGFERDFGVQIQARIGVNTGEVIAGDPASEESFVSGDAVNVAARLEQAAEPGAVLLGEATHRLVRAAVIAEPVEPLAARGKSEPVAAYRLVVVDAGGEMLPRRLDAPLVGRRDELSVLKVAFEEVVAGRTCKLITLLGEAGLGKSRLALELLRIVGADARVLRGRCLPYGEGITFWPVAEVLEDAAGIQPGEAPEEVRAKLEALLPLQHRGFGERLAALVGVGGAGGAIQETFLAVRRCLEALADAAPLVVVFDDIQWADGAFLDLVQYLATFVAGAPLLLLCLARPELLETRPDWTRFGQSLRLEPLDPGGGATLVANLMGEEGTPTEVASTIVRAASGNPLFIEEMVRMLVDQGVLVRRGERWVLAGDLAHVGAPETVHAVIAARLDRLEPGERAILQSAAVVGEVFWWSAVADLTDEATPVEVARRLQSLARKDLIRPDPSTFFSEDAFRFGHVLIRDVAYESLPKKARAALHERFSRWVEQRAGERSTEYDEIIGYHGERAYRCGSELAPPNEAAIALAVAAAERLASAGSRAFDRGDMAAAVNLFSRSIALYPKGDHRVPALLKSLGYALEENGRLDEADVALQQAAEGAIAIGDRGLELHAVTKRLHLQFYRLPESGHDEFVEVIEQGRGVFEELGDYAGLAEITRLRGIIHVWGGRCSQALRVFEEAIGLAMRGEDRRLELDARHWMSLALQEGPTPADEAIARIVELVQGNENDRVLWWQTRRHLAELEAMRGRFSEARSFLTEANEAARELGMETEAAAGHMRSTAEVSYMAGDLEVAEAELRRAVETLERIGDNGHLASCAPDLARVVLAAGGREREALELAELSESVSIDDDVDAEVRWRSVKARVLSRLGDAAEAERLARDSVERAWKTDYPKLRAISQEALSEVLHRSGRGVEAAEALNLAISVHEAKGNVVSAEADRRALVEMQATAEIPGSTRGRTLSE